MGEADDATGKLGKTFGGMGKLAALAGGAVGVGVVVGGLKSVVGAAKDAQVSQRGVETALKQAGTTYEAHKGQIDSVIRRRRTSPRSTTKTSPTRSRS
jgi:hypothetical protein